MTKKPCHRIFADGILWNGPHQYLRRQCAEHCLCPQSEDDLAFSEVSSDTSLDLSTDEELGSMGDGQSEKENADPNMEVTTIADMLFYVYGQGGRPSKVSVPTGSEQPTGSVGLQLTNAVPTAAKPPVVLSSPAVNQPSCPLRCRSDDRGCGRVRIGGKPCLCMFEREVNAGEFFFQGHCGLHTPRRQRRSSRNTITGCACNASYVSEACCDAAAAGGMVWESPRKKLGVLKFI
ncbi:MAG: hypothetical protein M1817_004126 [Caeruleum heppii]|nr:MAG: hypothetical protein M1817_004126 [Caeruleum heppii]